MQPLDAGPEFRLLLDCSAPGLQGAAIAAMRPLKIDWPRFLKLVARHRVAPAVFQCLNVAGDPAVPAAVLDRLRRRAHSASVRALRHAALALELAAVFEQHGIQTLALKGAALSRRLFGDAGLREVRDADLLVRPGALADADGLLRQRGFARRFPRLDPTPRRLAALLRREQHFEYEQIHTGLRVELHWQIESWDAEGLEWLWRHSQLRTWDAGALRELDELALVLFVVAHGARHKWFCVKWLADAARLLSGIPPSAIAPLLEAARTLDLTRPLAQAALLVRQLYRVPLPAALVDLPSVEPVTPYLVREALRAMRGSVQEHLRGHSPRAWWRNRRYARSLDHRARRHWPGMLRTRDFDLVPLPDWLFWLYYPLRPLLWLRRALRGSVFIGVHRRPTLLETDFGR